MNCWACSLHQQYNTPLSSGSYNQSSYKCFLGAQPVTKISTAHS
uniref:Uncharacterized protein n=1 Tax=Anguilla anguilla TaxID=7936 RepID=A0A0E9RIY8_ANGAN